MLPKIFAIKRQSQEKALKIGANTNALFVFFFFFAIRR
jgi:hypothetical protein